MLKTHLELQTTPWQVISNFAFLPDSPAPAPPPLTLHHILLHSFCVLAWVWCARNIILWLCNYYFLGFKFTFFFFFFFLEKCNVLTLVSEIQHYRDDCCYYYCGLHDQCNQLGPSQDLCFRRWCCLRSTKQWQFMNKGHHLNHLCHKLWVAAQPQIWPLSVESKLVI